MRGDSVSGYGRVPRGSLVPCPFWLRLLLSSGCCVPDRHGEVPGYRMVIEKDDGKNRLLIRVAITSKAIYRAVATSSSGFHDDPVITRFVNSFSLQ